jgi:hypothetical protein
VKSLAERVEFEVVCVDNASGVVAAASDKIAGTLKTASLSYLWVKDFLSSRKANCSGLARMLLLDIFNCLDL